MKFTVEKNGIKLEAEIGVNTHLESERDLHNAKEAWEKALELFEPAPSTRKFAPKEDAKSKILEYFAAQETGVSQTWAVKHSSVPQARRLISALLATGELESYPSFYKKGKSLRNNMTAVCLAGRAPTLEEDQEVMLLAVANEPEPKTMHNLAAAAEIPGVRAAAALKGLLTLRQIESIECLVFLVADKLDNDAPSA